MIIAEALVEEFGDLSSLRTKLNEDVTTLKQQLVLSNINKTTSSYSQPSKAAPTVNHKSSSSSKGKGWIIGLLIIIGIIVFATSSSRNSSSNISSTSSNSQRSSTTSAKATAKPTNKPASQTEKLYSDSSSVGDYVYVNIVLIEPEYGVYKYSTYDDYVCKCTTDTGKTVWISFDATSYRSKIDFSIDMFVSTVVSGFSGKRVRFSPAAKIHGKVVRSSSVMSGLDTKIYQTSIIEYSSIDIPQQTKNQKTTISIKTIFPSYTITSGNSIMATHVLCEYTDSLGKKNWIYMTISEYKEYFDSSANPVTDKYANEKKFSIAKKVIVTSEYVDDLISGASSSIGQKTVYVFSDVN